MFARIQDVNEVAHLSYFAVLLVTAIAGASVSAAFWVLFSLGSLIVFNFSATYFRFEQVPTETQGAMRLLMNLARILLSTIAAFLVLLSVAYSRGTEWSENHVQDIIEQYVDRPSVISRVDRRNIKDTSSDVAKEVPHSPAVTVVYAEKGRGIWIPLRDALQLVMYEVAQKVNGVAIIAAATSYLFFGVCLFIRRTSPGLGDGEGEPETSLIGT